MLISQDSASISTDVLPTWIERHTNLAAAVVTLLGFLARLWAASGTFLNPDEAIHVRLANQPSLALVYKQSLTGLHPPLLVLLLHLWRGLGFSELWLRLPSVIAGTVFCWLFFQWLTQVAGRLTGFIGLMFVALLPPQIMLSAEIRQYALLLALLAAALLFQERAFAGNSVVLMLTSALCLCLAMLTHYSAIFFAGALGAYALAKIFVPPSQRPPVRLIASWIVGQLGALALCVFLYKTHLSRHDLQDTQVLQGWMSYMNRSSYFEPGHDNPLLFAVGHSFGVFQFLFGQLAVGIAMGLAFLAGLGLLLSRRYVADSVAPSRQLAILFAAPFALACAASFLHVYPYGGTRHIAFLIIPAAACVSIAIAHFAALGLTRSLSTGRPWARAVVIATVVLTACITFGRPRPPHMDRADQSRAHMADAIAFLRQEIAPADLIFTDYQSDLLLGTYLCPQQTVSLEQSSANFERFPCAGYRVISNYKQWQFWADNFPQAWQQFVRAYNPAPGSTVWIVQMGWGVALPEDLRQHLIEFRNLHFDSFGNNIKIFKLTVPPPAPAN